MADPVAPGSKKVLATFEEQPTAFEAWPSIRAAILDRFHEATKRVSIDRAAWRAAEAKMQEEMAAAADNIRPPPVFASWADFLQRTTPRERMERCHNAANKANKRQRSSGAIRRLKGSDVWGIIEAAQGRCVYCGSFAVERCPAGAWGLVGRRIGSLEHLNGRCSDNEPANLAWACHWCNTKPDQRRMNALDHGGFYPTE